MAKPYPPPLTYDADRCELVRRPGGVTMDLATLADVPGGLTPPQERTLLARLNATGEALARRYNAHAALVEACRQAYSLIGPQHTGEGLRVSEALAAALAYDRAAKEMFGEFAVLNILK